MPSSLTIDMGWVVSKAIQLIKTYDPPSICAGLTILTGLKINQIGMISRNGVTRQLKAHDEYSIIFKGISKNKNPKEFEIASVRPVLCSSELIEQSWRFLMSTQVVLDTGDDDQSFRNKLSDSTRHKFKEVFGQKLTPSTNLEVTNQKDVSTRVARDFYAAALKEILKTEGKSDADIKKYLQISMGYSSGNMKSICWNKFDEIKFKNIPSIPIPLSFDEIGEINIRQKVTFCPKIKISEFKENPLPTKSEPTFTLSELIALMPSNVLMKFNILISQGTEVKEAFVQMLKGETKEVRKEILIIKQTVLDNPNEEIELILDSIFHYNLN